jgi:hypothetical protein
MSKWRKIQKELIEKSIRGEKLDIVQKDVNYGGLAGTIYYKEKTNPKKGILMAPGMSSNRYAFGVLAERLAEYGFLCLSIDLPSHYLDSSRFTLGEVSERITEGVTILKQRYGMNRIAVLGHSVGAVGALFANAGYSTDLEQRIYSLWEGTAGIMEREAVLLQKNNTSEAVQLNQEIGNNYTELKELIFHSLKKGIKEHYDVTCYIFLAPPTNCKAAIPGLRLLRHLPQKWLKKIFEEFLHKPLIKQLYREGNPAKYVPEQDPRYVSMQMFKTSEPHEFLEYFLNMKEPTDFLSMIENIIQFKHRDDKISFFEYYQKTYLVTKPKLFIYGTRDILLKPFMPFAKGKLERLYRSCGNAEVYHGSFSHIMVENPNQHIGFVGIKDEWVTELIMEFLDKNM